MSPQEPARLGEYHLLERLGQGGMAMVYRAERVGEAGFKKKVAIKRMLPAYRRDRSLLERFAAEARTNARLDHPNLVQVVDFGIEPEPYLVMEFVEGVTLAALLQRLVDQHQPLEVAAACFIGAEAAQGLDHAHRKRDEQGNPLGIVHRDVSPQNVLLSNEGAVKVSDFGLVKAADNVVQTGSGVPIGKMSYMAPEQAGHTPVDARADVFSLGIVVWEMLTMRTLMPPNDPGRASAMLVACEFSPPSRYNPKVPAALDDVVMRCLAKDPEQRTPSAQALSMQLREILHELAPGYGRDQLARLLTWAFVEKGWSIDEPHETAAQPSAAERMSMPQIPAADVMERASLVHAAPAPETAAVTGSHAAQAAPVVPEPAPVAARRKRGVLPWVIVLAALGVLGLVLVVVLTAVALFAVRTSDAGASPPPPPPMQPLPAPAVQQSAQQVGPALVLDTDTPGARIFLGDHEIGRAPIAITAAQLDGRPIVAIAPGHQPAVVPSEALARSLADGTGRQILVLAPSAQPDRAVYVRYPRPATARLAFTGAILGPVPGLVLVPAPPPGAVVAPQVEIVEPGLPALRMSTASCDPSAVCVLEGGAL